QTNFNEQQQAKIDKAQYDNNVNTVTAAIAANWADPTKNPPVDVAKISQLPWFQAHPDAVTKILDYQRALQRPDGEPGVSARNTSALYGKLFPSDGSPALNQNDVDAAFVSQDPAVHINREDHDWLTKQIADSKDPDAKRINGLANDVYKVVERQIDP